MRYKKIPVHQINLKLTPLFFLCLVLLGCQSKETTEIPIKNNVTLRLDLIHELADNVLTDLKSDNSFTVIVDSLDRAYVLVSSPKKGYRELIRFSQNGSVDWKIDDQGQAPGELKSTLGIAWDYKDKLYIGNQSGNRIDQLSLDGEFIDSKYTQNFTEPMNPLVGINIVGFRDSEHFLAMKYIYGKMGAQILTVSITNDWAVTDTFSIDQTTGPSFSQVAFVPVLNILEGSLVVGHLTEYKYTFYNPNAEPYLTLSIPNRLFAPPITKDHGQGRISFKQFSKMYPIVAVGDYFLGGAEWPEEIDVDLYRSKLGDMNNPPPNYDLRYSLDVFDNDTGEYLATFDPRKYGIKKILASDSKGRIYAEFFDEDKGLGCFQVSIDRL